MELVIIQSRLFLDVEFSLTLFIIILILGFDCITHPLGIWYWFASLA